MDSCSQLEDHIHRQIITHYDKVKNWFQKKSQGRVFPFYSSFDMRSGGGKIAPVDANLFPAGFNNICDIDKHLAPLFCKTYLKKHHPKVKNVILLAEEHTHNPFYWDNIYTLKVLLENTHLSSVWVCVPGKNILKNQTIISAKGYPIEVFTLKQKQKEANLIVSNNDFSTDYQLPESLLAIPSPLEGWRYRKKHHFFNQYNLLAQSFAKLIEIDPFILSIQTECFTNFDINNPDCLKKLKNQVTSFIKKLKPFYKKTKPFVFLKNNSGTYGLGITRISCAEDIDHWNYKIRKKMKASKGGRKLTELILQEGIVSHLKTEGLVSEPVLYFIGEKVIGGFLRAHKHKGATDNLNSPGAVYRTLCISDLEIEVEGKVLENVYGWIAHLSALAVTFEIS